jgi:hypothetical protein
MNKLKIAVLSFALLIGVTALVPSYDVGASAKSEITKGYEAAGGNQETVTTQARVNGIVNLMLYIIGVLSVIVIVFAGIRYVTSTGDSSRVKGAKDTLTYAVIGLIVAILAYAIVNFVLTNL